MRRVRAALPWCVVGTVAMAGACDKPDATPAANPSSAPPAADVTVTGEWPAALGPVLVVPTDTETQAVVLYPVGADLGAAAATRLTLLGPSGDTIQAQTRLSAGDSLHCGDAPVVRVTRAAPPTWSVGIVSRDAKPVRSDSLDALSGRDSAFVASEMARLASAVPSGDRVRFSRIPFAVTALRRLKVGGRDIVAAQLVRRLNQEADPGEEHTLVVGERDPTLPGTPFEAVHASRSEGTEDSAEHFDLVAALRGSGATWFVIAREKPASITVEILERSDTHRWRVRWTRTVTC